LLKEKHNTTATHQRNRGSKGLNLYNTNRLNQTTEITWIWSRRWLYWDRQIKQI